MQPGGGSQDKGKAGKENLSASSAERNRRALFPLLWVPLATVSTYKGESN